MQQRSASSIKKALRKHAIPWSDMRDVDVALEELNTESDRGMMLLIATQLEDALAHYITLKLPGMTKSEHEGFLGPEGPAGAFGVKIKLALGMGILNRRAYDALEIVRHIRNAGAHSIRPVTFDTPIIREAVISVASPDLADQMQSANAEVIRLIFRMACLTILDSFAQLGGPGGHFKMIAALTSSAENLDEGD